MILVTVTLSDWIYRSVVSRSVLTLQPRLLPAEEAAGAAGLRDRPQALRPAGGVEDRARDAAEEDRLDQPAAGVPQDDPRHRRGGRAARLHAEPRRAATSSWCGRGPGCSVARSGRWGGAGLGPRARTPRRGRSAPGLGRAMCSWPTGGGSGPAPGGRGSAARAAFLAFVRVAGAGRVTGRSARGTPANPSSRSARGTPTSRRRRRSASRAGRSPRGRRRSRRRRDADGRRARSRRCRAWCAGRGRRATAGRARRGRW